MLAVIKGIEFMRFDNTEGLKLHINYSNNKVTGEAADNRFMDSSHPSYPLFVPFSSNASALVGKKIMIDTDLKGKIQDVQFIDVPETDKK